MVADRLSLGEMAFVLLGSLQKSYPDQLHSILRAGTALPPDMGHLFPEDLFVADDGSLTVLSLINSLLVALGEPKVAIVCPSDPAGRILPTTCGVLLLDHNDEVVYGYGNEEDEAPEEGGGAATATPGPPPGGDSG